MNFAKLLHNKTYATVRAEPMMDRHGADVLVVVAKLALAYSRTGQLGLSARTVRMHDEPDGAGGLRYPSDLAAEKVGTDIGLVGTLVPPDRPGVTQAFAWLRVGTLARAVQVFGPRVFTGGLQGVVPGPAAPLGRTPLVHALARGGTDEDATPWSFEPFNPTGRGHAASAGKLIGRPAPQIEPASLPEVPSPPGVKSSLLHAQTAFAPVPPQWEPRRSRAGTQDAHWGRTRAPVAPEDYDPRSESWASPGLWSETPLTGAEPVEIGGLHPGAPVRFLLPGFAPSFHSVEAGALRHHPTHLDGVLFDADDGVVELVWRAAIPLPLKWARLERVDVLPARPLAPEIVDRPQMRGSPS